MIRINVNYKIMSVLLVLLGILLILVLLRDHGVLEPKSEKESAEVFIYKESDLEAAIGKNVFLKAELYFDKLPILKFKNTPMYCWDKDEPDGRKGTAKEIINSLNIIRLSDKGQKVKVWGKLGKYQSTSNEDQLHDGRYELEYYRMEVDDGNIDSTDEDYCYSNNWLWDCLDKKVLLEGTYVQETDVGGKGGAFPLYEFNSVKWGKANFNSLDLGPVAPFSQEFNARRMIIEGIPRVGIECCKNCQCLEGQIPGRWPNELEITDYKILN